MPWFDLQVHDGGSPTEDPAGGDPCRLGAAPAEAEDVLASAELQIQTAETRIAGQTAIVQGLETAGDARAAEQAKEMLSIMRVGLALANFRLVVELASPEHERGRQAW